MTLLNTYQSCKELIANNLQLKGVQANSDEGLTTLANKILDINTQENNNKYTDVTCTCNISVPNNFPYQNELKNLEIVLIGKETAIDVKYSHFIENMYRFNHIKLGTYLIYSPNAMTLFSDKNIIVTSDSTVINHVNLTSTDTYPTFLDIKYQSM